MIGRAVGRTARVFARIAVAAFTVAAFTVAAGGAKAGAQSADAPSADATTADPKPLAPGVSASLDSARAVRGASLSVSLFTYGPSDVFFERFGHAGIAVRDSATGLDVVFNWGMFDFAQPNFLVNFLTGDTKYWIAGFSTSQFNATYQRDRRTIRQQVLALTPVERAVMFELLQWNARDANMYYRYDYYQQNCATMARDAIDYVLGGRLRPALQELGSGRTWRGETARLLGSMLPLYAGIEIALGRHADEPLSRWNEEFLPEHMASHYATLVLPDAAGRRYRLVAQDTTIYTSDRIPLPSEPPSRVPMSALLGLTLAGLLAWLADARSRMARVVLTVFVSAWYLVGGLMGTALLLAATVTKHAPYMGANTTLLLLHPLLLVAAVAVPLAFARHRSSRIADGVSATIAVLSVCGALVQLVPSLAQTSGVVLATVIPVHVAIAIGTWRLGHHRRHD